jgi:NADPH:quinone reductase-like Zn-dependent oxidoreductase
MKAFVYEKYGSPDVLELREVEKPTLGADDLLVQVRAASVNPYDWHLLTGLPMIGRLLFGLRGPQGDGRLGADFAGQVEAVGPNVTRFRPGDAVFGMVDGGVPGKPLLDLGSLAEYVRVSQDSAAPKPAGLTFEEAAAVPAAGITALAAIQDQGRVGPGQRVLINGASGGVGPFAVQIAKALGAEVTGVCSTRNVEVVRSLGADHVVDYTREDFTEGDGRFDLMLDNVGNRSLSECRRVLKPGATYFASFGRPENRWLGPFLRLIYMGLVSRFASQKLVSLAPRRTPETLDDLKRLIEEGKVRVVIDRTYPLDQAPDAMRYLEEGHARGKVVITV